MASAHKFYLLMNNVYTYFGIAGVMEFCLKSYLVSYFDNEINPDILNQLLVVTNPRTNFWQFFF